MPRKPREELAGGIHHVFARGNAKEAIYRDDVDRHRYLLILGRTVVRQGWRCLAYCLMDNHVHLLIETPAPNLGRGMQWLHGLYAQAFNDRHRRPGHVFQGRFGAVRIKSDAQLLMVARYIARNPVEGGLCGEPHEWPWSSHAAALVRTTRGEEDPRTRPEGTPSTRGEENPSTRPGGTSAARPGETAPAWLDTARLLDFFGAGGGDSRRRYVDFVALR